MIREKLNCVHNKFIQDSLVDVALSSVGFGMNELSSQNSSSSSSKLSENMSFTVSITPCVCMELGKCEVLTLPLLLVKFTAGSVGEDGGMKGFGKLRLAVEREGVAP